MVLAIRIEASEILANSEIVTTEKMSFILSLQRRSLGLDLKR
jgi:hypothetical protein